MSWTDIFYPGNSTKKTKLAELSGQLYAQMEKCVTAVNHLIDCIENNLHGKKFEKIALQMTKSFADNCNIITSRANEINAYLEQKANDVKLLIGTELFNQLMSLETTFQQKIDTAKKVVKITLAIGLGVGAVYLTAKILSEKILTKVVAKIGKYATCALAFIVLSAFLTAVDMIISVILGAIEEEKLNEALKEYEEAVKTFTPAADEFYDSISMIRITLKSMK